MICRHHLKSAADEVEHELLDTDEEHLCLEDSFTVCFLLKGDCHVKYHSNLSHIRENDIFFFPPEIPYSVICGGKRVSCYRILVSRRWLESRIPFLCAVQFDHFHITREINPAFYQSVCRCIASILFSSLSDPHTRKLRVLAYTGILLLSIQREFQNSISPRRESSDYVEERIARIQTYIREHYSEKINLETASACLGLNPQYFSSFFSKHFHEKFTDYLNRYRVDRSLSDLLHTEKSLLEIALDHGFQSNKSYSNSFRRYYNELPSVYRFLHAAPNPEPGAADPQQSPFEQTSFLYENFWDKNMMPGALSPDIFLKEASVTPLSLELDLRNPPTVLRDRRMKSINIGTGFYLLQEDVYEQLKRVKKECSFTYVHMRDILGDLLKVYAEPRNDRPNIFWGNLDRIIRRVVDLGFLPFLEIGFMPSDLSSSDSKLGYSYHPYTGMPKSMDQWKNLIRSFLLHYRELYGDAILEWKFDFWNTANIGGKDGFWNGTQEQFFALYKATWDTFQSVDPRLQLGSPNFSLPDGISWYEDFFAFCRKERIRPSHASLHLYSCRDNLTNFEGVFPYSSASYNYLTLTSTQYAQDILRSFKETLADCGFGDLPVIASEWNITFFLTDLIRDTSFMSAYLAHTYIHTIPLVDGLSFFCLSDNNDQSRPSNLAFDGNSGLFDMRNTPKAAYHAFRLLHKLDADAVTVGENYIVTRSPRGFHLMVYNLCEYERNLDPDLLGNISHNHRYQAFRDTNPVRFKGILHVKNGSYDIRRYTLDQDHGSSYDAWVHMGSPEQITPEIADILDRQSSPALHCSRETNTSVISLECMVEPHGVVLFEIIRNDYAS